MSFLALFLIAALLVLTVAIVFSSRASWYGARDTRQRRDNTDARSPVVAEAPMGARTLRLIEAQVGLEEELHDEKQQREEVAARVVTGCPSERDRGSPEMPPTHQQDDPPPWCEPVWEEGLLPKDGDTRPKGSPVQVRAIEVAIHRRPARSYKERVKELRLFAAIVAVLTLMFPLLGFLLVPAIAIMLLAGALTPKKEPDELFVRCPGCGNETKLIQHAAARCSGCRGEFVWRGADRIEAHIGIAVDETPR